MEFILEIIWLEKIKDGTYAINFDEYTEAGTHWIALYVENIEITYFNIFRGEFFRKETENFIGHKNDMI